MLHFEVVAEPAPAPPVVVGVGGAGMRLLDAVRAEGLRGVKHVAADTDLAAVRAADADERVELDAGTGGRGTGGQPDLGRDAVLRAREPLEAAIGAADLVILVGGLGGGTGTGGLPVLGAAARQCGALVVAFVTLPGAPEGPGRAHRARAGWPALVAAADVVVPLPFDRLPRPPRSRRLAAVFQRMDAVGAAGAAAVAAPVVEPAALVASDDWLGQALRGAGEGLLGTATVPSGGALAEAVGAALGGPLSERSFAAAGTVLLSFRAGPDLALADLSAGVDAARARLDPGAKLHVALSFGPPGEARVTAIGTRLRLG